MGKSLVSTLISNIKKRADYSITDSSLDNLIVDMINDSVGRIRQKLLDRGLFTDISKSTTLTTVADQAYVDVSTITDLDEIIVQSDRTNDRTIMLITYDKFIQLYPDPTENTSNSPIHAARWDNKIYFGPTPSEVLTLYFDYIKLFSTLTSSSTMPIQDKYDRLVVAMCVAELKEWLGLDSVQLTAALAREKRLDDEIFLGASNIGVVRADASRRDIMFDPMKPISPTVGYGYGFGSYGSIPYGA